MMKMASCGDGCALQPCMPMHGSVAETREPVVEIIQNSEVIDQIQIINGLKEGTSPRPFVEST